MVAHVLVWLLASAVPLGQSAAGAQATLKGAVRDQQGGAIGGAAVSIVCGAVERHVTTSATGEFEVPHLPAAECSATASSALFDEQTTNVNLAGGTARADFVLPVRRFLTELVVTPSRGTAEDGFTVPESLSVTTRREMDARPSQLLPQVLRDEPGVLLQQTTSAQASPIIRGFTGQSNVYLLDGVRLNTAAWRSGPSQYLGWIDTAVADRIEIVRGPGSVQYGSDALGGTINVTTAPSLFSSRGLQPGGTVAVSVGSADRSSGADGSLRLRFSGASIRFGGATREIDNLRGGGGKDSHAAVTKYLGLPSTVVDTRMLATDYRQSGGSFGGNFNAGGAATLSTLVVHEDQAGASRYDRVLGGDGNYISGFDPQTLDFGFVKYQRPSTAGFDTLSATFSVNRQADGRFEQARPTARLDSQQSVTSVLGYQVQGTREVRGRQRLLVGAELYDESTSASRELREPSGSVTQQRPDIPDGTTYSSLGVFVQDSADLVPGRVNVRGGLRYGRFDFRTIDDPSFGVTAERVTTDAITFQLGTVVSLGGNLNAVFNVSRGFRAANAADLGDIGLSGGGGFSVTPSKAAALGGYVGTSGASTAVSTGERVQPLDPEVLYSYEAGLKFRSRTFDASMSAYDLEWFDTVQRRAIVFDTNVVGTSISGFEIVRQDANGLAYIAQDVRPIGTRVNLDHARLRGFDVQGSAHVGRHLDGTVYFSMTNGRLLATDEYLRRMPPPLGGARLRWDTERLWVEGVMNFARTQTRLNSGDLTDARIGGVRTRTSIASFFNGTATDMGLVQNGVLVATGETLGQVQTRLLGTASSGFLYTVGPGYAVFGLRAGVRVTRALDVSLLGENLTDRNYRLYGSGLDAPGINVQLRVRYRF